MTLVNKNEVAVHRGEDVREHLCHPGKRWQLIRCNYGTSVSGGTATNDWLTPDQAKAWLLKHADRDVVNRHFPGTFSDGYPPDTVGAASQDPEPVDPFAGIDDGEDA